MTIDLNTIFNAILATVLGYISYTFQTREKSHLEKHKEVDEKIENIKKDNATSTEKLYKEFVTRDEHCRDINAIEKKIDDIYNLMLGVKGDIGVLIGKGEKNGQ